MNTDTDPTNGGVDDGNTSTVLHSTDQQVTDSDGPLADYDRADAEARQDAAYQQHCAEMDARRQREHNRAMEYWRTGSWDPTASRIRMTINQRLEQNAAPRIARATRTSRITTGRRTTTMAASSSSGGDDSGGEPSHDPAPLGAEGRATGGASDDSGPWLTFIEEQRLHREIAQRARSRSRYMRDVRGMRGWSS